MNTSVTKKQHKKDRAADGLTQEQINRIMNSPEAIAKREVLKEANWDVFFKKVEKIKQELVKKESEEDNRKK